MTTIEAQPKELLEANIQKATKLVSFYFPTLLEEEHHISQMIGKAERINKAQDSTESNLNDLFYINLFGYPGDLFSIEDLRLVNDKGNLSLSLISDLANIPLSINIRWESIQPGIPTDKVCINLSNNRKFEFIPNEKTFIVQSGPGLNLSSVRKLGNEDKITRIEEVHPNGRDLFMNTLELQGDLMKLTFTHVMGEFAISLPHTVELAQFSP